MKLKTKLLEYRKLNGLASEIIFSNEENQKYKQLVQQGKKLPEGVYRKVENNADYFYTVADDYNELTHEEALELIAHMQLEKLSTIKSCCVFFTVLAIVGIVIGAISFIYVRSTLGL